MEIYTPDDQLANLKAWWKQYGAALIAGVVIGGLLLGGGNYWKQHKTKRAEAASLLYESLLADLQQLKPDALTATAMDGGSAENAGAVFLPTATTLMQDYEATPYAGKAALLLARSRFDAKDIAGTRQHLEWAMRNATEVSVQHSARLRLGRLLLDQGDTEAALTLANVKETDGFASEYEELKGDVLLVKGDRQAARRAYQAAIVALASGSSYAQALGMKRDNLGREPTP